MIKEEIRSTIFNLLPKLDRTSKFHPRVIDAAIERVLMEMYQELFDENPLYLQRFTKGYGYTTPLAVAAEGTTGIYYTTLPAKVIPFRDKASGVRRISTVVNTGLSFIPIDQREADILTSGSFADMVTSKIGYMVTPERIEYYKMSGSVPTDGVRTDLIVPFSVYADTDNVLIPETKGPQGETFIDRVLKILQVIQPIDLLDNNADTVKGNE
jgi:hypothetical protein